MKRVETAVNSLNSFHQNNTRFCLRALLSRNWRHVWPGCPGYSSCHFNKKINSSPTGSGGEIPALAALRRRRRRRGKEIRRGLQGARRPRRRLGQDSRRGKKTMKRSTRSKESRESSPDLAGFMQPATFASFLETETVPLI